MKKILFIMAALLLALFIGCVPAVPSAPTNIETGWYTRLSPVGEGDTEPLGAVVYFPIPGADELPDAVCDLPLCDLSGWEYYLIAPRYEGDTVTVQPLVMEEESAALRAEGEPIIYDAPFVLCCNPSDIFSNVSVTLRHGEESITFSPHVSLRDGSVVTDARAPVCEWVQ